MVIKYFLAVKFWLLLFVFNENVMIFRLFTLHPPLPSKYLNLKESCGTNWGFGCCAVANKQQAPLPPNAVHLGGKLWDSSTC